MIIIIAQINLLMALVNDMLDLKLIEEGLFTPKIERFKPWDTLLFIKKMISLNGPTRVENTRIEVKYEEPHEEFVGD